MCSPTLVISAFSQAIKFQQANKQQKIARAQALKQREIADKNYRLKVAQERLKIRQKAKLEKQKAGAVDIQSRQARAEARVGAETFTGGVLDRVLGDYYRQQGNYKASVLANLDNEIAQSDMNIKGYGVELEANTPYIPKVNTLGLVGASALSWGNDYYTWKGEKEKMDLLKKRKIGGYDYSYYGSSE
jgi:hypothetical protein